MHCIYSNAAARVISLDEFNLTGGGISLLVKETTGAAEAGDHGDDEDGRGGAHQDPDQHRQAGRTHTEREKREKR